MKKSLVLIDGHAVMHRAYHALPPLTTKDGQPIGAVYGTILILLKIIKDLKPTHIAFTFDMKGPTFRHKQFREYKIHRPPTPQDLISQQAVMEDVLGAFGIPFFALQGFEAEDVIAAIAAKFKALPRRQAGQMSNVKIKIVTGDLDLLQLVEAQTEVYAMRKGMTDFTLYNKETMQEAFGLSPKDWVFFKALRGDASDNIPGVKGIGEKTAQKLIHQYHSLENLYRHLDQLPKDLQKLLKKYRQDALLSYKLAKILANVPVKFQLTNLAFKPDLKSVQDKFLSLGFNSLIKRLESLNLKAMRLL